MTDPWLHGDGTADEIDDGFDEVDRPSWRDRSGLAPALAVAALAMAFAAFNGTSVLSGFAYVRIDFPSGSDVDDHRLLAGLLATVLCGLPAALGACAVRWSRVEDPSWTVPVAGGAVVVAATAAVLKLVSTLLTATGSGSAGYFL